MTFICPNYSFRTWRWQTQASVFRLNQKPLPQAFCKIFICQRDCHFRFRIRFARATKELSNRFRCINSYAVLRRFVIVLYRTQLTMGGILSQAHIVMPVIIKFLWLRNALGYTGLLLEVLKAHRVNGTYHRRIVNWYAYHPHDQISNHHQCSCFLQAVYADLNKLVITEHENDFRRYIDSVRLCFDFFFRLGNMENRSSLCIRSGAANLVEYFENPSTVWKLWAVPWWS